MRGAYLAGDRSQIPMVMVRCLPNRQVMVDSGLKNHNSQPWMEEEAVAVQLEAKGIVERVGLKAAHVPENKRMRVPGRKKRGRRA